MYLIHKVSGNLYSLSMQTSQCVLVLSVRRCFAIQLIAFVVNFEAGHVELRPYCQRCNTYLVDYLGIRPIALRGLFLQENQEKILFTILAGHMQLQYIESSR